MNLTNNGYFLGVGIELGLYVSETVDSGNDILSSIERFLLFDILFYHIFADFAIENEKPIRE